MTADDVIARLELQAHPEGGWYRQTWVAEAAPGARPVGTAIYFLLKAGEASHWHTVDASEIWLWHAGAPMEVRISGTDAGPAVTHPLGPDLQTMRPQVIVPKGAWQSARLAAGHGPDAWGLVSCTVSPGFQFEGFHLAPAGFDIP